MEKIEYAKEQFSGRWAGGLLHRWLSQIVDFVYKRQNGLLITIEKEIFQGAKASLLVRR